MKIPFSNNVNTISEAVTKKSNLTRNISNFETKHIAIMLPFRMNRVNFDSVPDIRNSIRKDPYLDASLDFYTGVLTALDSLKTMGVSLIVDVYDTKYQVSEVATIVRDNAFKNLDAVIGPLTPETFEAVALALKSYNTPVVSPIGTNLNLYENVFQSRPSDDLLKTKVVNYIKKDASAKNVVIISDAKNATIANQLKSEFGSAILVTSRKNKAGSGIGAVARRRH